MDYSSFECNKVQQSLLVALSRPFLGLFLDYFTPLSEFSSDLTRDLVWCLQNLLFHVKRSAGSVGARFILVLDSQVLNSNELHRPFARALLATVGGGELLANHLTASTILYLSWSHSRLGHLANLAIDDFGLLLFGLPFLLGKFLSLLLLYKVTVFPIPEHPFQILLLFRQVEVGLEHLIIYVVT